MKVNLKRNFYDGINRWRSAHNPHEMPDSMKSSLPKDAEIVSVAKKKAKKSAKDD